MTAATNNDKWQQLLSEYWAVYKVEHPAIVSEFDHTYRREFAKEAVEDYQRRYAQDGDFLQRLTVITVDELCEEDRVSYQILRQELELFREYFELDGHLRPTLFPFGPETDIGYLGVDRTTLLSIDDAKDYLARMACFSQLFRDTEQRLQKGLEKGYFLPAVLLEPVINNTLVFTGAREEDSTWYKPFNSPHIANAAGIAELQAEAKRCIRKEIEPAYHNFVNYLREYYSPHCSENIACYEQTNGKAFYQLLIRYHTSLDLPPEEIHQIGLQEVGRIYQEMEGIAEEAGYKNNLDGYRHFINTDPQFFLPGKEALRERIEILSKRIDRLIPEYFGRIPRMTYGVESTPEGIAAQRPVALAQPNPADGTASGIHWITSLPERCPTYMHIPLALHEAWPGHLMHMALMQEIDNLPLFRRINFVNYNAYVEGWALYCEHLGLDMGMYQTPYEHYGRLDMEIWRAVRLVVDTGIHGKGWSRQQAISYMQEYLAQPKETIEAEVDRYIGSPGQALSYKLGELKIRELRQRAMDLLGDQFGLRDFHDCVLATGPVTLTILEEQVQRWIDKKIATKHL